MRILAILAEARTARACLDGAISAAAIDPEALIEALHVKVDPDRLMRASEEVAIQRLRERDEGTAEQRAQAVRAAFDTWAGGVSRSDRGRVRWREDVGAEAENVLREAATADLLVLARPHNMDSGDAFHVAVFSAHRPLLVPPDWPSDHGLGRRMAVAWSATSQSAKAVEGAAPWLRSAEKVTVVMIAKSEIAGGWPGAERLLRQLGVMATSHLIPPDGEEPALRMLAAARELGADTLVMGAYRHNEFVEWALGSTTRKVIAAAEIPLFLAH